MRLVFVGLHLARPCVRLVAEIIKKRVANFIENSRTNAKVVAVVFQKAHRSNTHAQLKQL
jgi:hypothetical protein